MYDYTDIIEDVNLAHVSHGVYHQPLDIHHNSYIDRVNGYIDKASTVYLNIRRSYPIHHMAQQSINLPSTSELPNSFSPVYDGRPCT